MKFQVIDTDWAATAAPSGHVPVGETIIGTTDGYRRLVAVSWKGEALPLTLPTNLMPLDQAAADELARQHPHSLHQLRAAPGVTIREWVNPNATADQAARDAWNAHVVEQQQLAAYRVHVAREREAQAVAEAAREAPSPSAPSPATSIDRRGM
jgi:hypothetical protein